MGLKGFSTFFSEQHPAAYTQLEDLPSECQHLMIDVNDILHRSFKHAAGYAQLLALVTGVLEACLNLPPLAASLSSLGLFLDGSAPLAKVEVQRSRRISLQRSRQRHPSSQSARGKQPTKPAAKQIGKDAQLINRLELTAGSLLMTRISQDLVAWSKQRLCRPPCKTTCVVVSGSDVAGEGEVKMFQLVSSLPNAFPERPLRVLVLGSDADVLLLSLCSLSLRPHISLYVASPPASSPASSESTEACFCSDRLILPHSTLRPSVGSEAGRRKRKRGRSCFDVGEEPGEGTRVGIATADSEHSCASIDIDANTGTRKHKHKHKHKHKRKRKNENTQENEESSEDMSKSHNPTNTDTNIDAAELDGEEEAREPRSSSGAELAAIAMLGGNDYLPPLRGVDYHRAWRMWMMDARAGTSQLIDVSRRTLSIAVLADIIAIAAIAARRDQAADSQHHASGDEHHHARGSEEEEEEEEEEEGAALARKTWMEEEEEFLWAPGGGRMFDTETYVQGLCWNLEMYLDGSCPDFTFRYSCPYAPSARELQRFASSLPPTSSLRSLRSPPPAMPPWPSAVAAMLCTPPACWSAELLGEGAMRLLASQAVQAHLRRLEPPSHRPPGHQDHPQGGRDGDGNHDQPPNTTPALADAGMTEPLALMHSLLDAIAALDDARQTTSGPGRVRSALLPGVAQAFTSGSAPLRAGSPRARLSLKWRPESQTVFDTEATGKPRSELNRDAVRCAELPGGVLPAA